jgi:hypothetical protein
MGEQKKSKKVIRIGRGLPFGGDPLVDRDGISTENHQQLYRRLIEAGPRMHGPQGAPKPRKSS